jgi:ribosomal protein S8
MSCSEVEAICTKLDELYKIEQTSQVLVQSSELFADVIEILEERGYLRQYDKDYIEHDGYQILTSRHEGPTISGYHGVTACEDREYAGWKETDDDIRKRPPYRGYYKAFKPGGGGAMIPGSKTRSAEEAGIARIKYCLNNEEARAYDLKYCRKHNIPPPNWA